MRQGGRKHPVIGYTLDDVRVLRQAAEGSVYGPELREHLNSIADRIESSLKGPRKPTPAETHAYDQQLASLVDLARTFGEFRRTMIEQGFSEEDATGSALAFARNFFGPYTPDFEEYIVRDE